MTAADRAQLLAWRTLIDLGDNLYYSQAQVAALVGLAERQAAEVVALLDGARADAAEIAGLRASVVRPLDMVPPAPVKRSWEQT